MTWWLRWSSSGAKKPKITGHRLEAAIRVSNQTGDDFDFTFVALAVDETGRATAVGYQRFTLKQNTIDFEIPFGENLPPGHGTCNVDVVAEIAATNTIHRARLAQGQSYRWCRDLETAWETFRAKN